MKLNLYNVRIIIKGKTNIYYIYAEGEKEAISKAMLSVESTISMLTVTKLCSKQSILNNTHVE